MKTPIFYKLNIKDYSYHSIKSLFVENNAGSVPLYFELDIQNEKLIKLALESISKVLSDLKINPRFPFPIYIINPNITQYKNLIIIAHENELPAHFKRKVQKLRNIELGLLTKAQVSSKRVENKDIDGQLIELQNYSEKNKLLNSITREAYYYQELLKALD